MAIPWVPDRKVEDKRAVEAKYDLPEGALSAPRCDQCRHCEPVLYYEPQRWRCVLTESDENESPHHPLTKAFCDSWEDGGGYLVVQPDFGCVQFEAKEAVVATPDLAPVRTFLERELAHHESAAFYHGSQFPIAGSMHEFHEKSAQELRRLLFSLGTEASP